jgi:hypothetical protein
MRGARLPIAKRRMRAVRRLQLPFGNQPGGGRYFAIGVQTTLSSKT